MLLPDVLEYHGRGWNCIPFQLNGAEKKPIVAWKRYQTERPTEKQLMEWFQRTDVNGVGIVTGPGQGSLAIRDFDSVAAYERWTELHPGWARELPTVRTFRGFHVYGNSDYSKNVKLGDGEYRGAGLTVAPPSTRGEFKYHWVTPLPPGTLPTVPHRILMGNGVAENAECHISDLSAVSATPLPHLDPPVSDVSALSALSATFGPDSRAALERHLADERAGDDRVEHAQVIVPRVAAQQDAVKVVHVEPA